MREIEFRGKLEENNQWVYGVPIFEEDYKNPIGEIFKGGAFICSNIDAYSSVYDLYRCCERVIPETIGQYTGLKDKKGTKIFEGDILTDNCCARKCRFHIQGYVAFDKYWGYVLKMNPEDDGDTNWRFDAEKTLEVIGNIHDNKLEEFYE